MLFSLYTCCSTNLVPSAFWNEHSLFKQIDSIFSSLPFFFLCLWQEGFLLVLALPQNGCQSAAAADGVVVHEQIDKLSSACIKTAHLRHEGRLLGVVRALSRRSLRLSSVVMEWLPTLEQTDWIPPDLSAHYISSPAVNSFFLSFFFIGCQS